jgi:hypothetical protein
VLPSLHRGSHCRYAHWAGKTSRLIFVAHPLGTTAYLAPFLELFCGIAREPAGGTCVDEGRDRVCVHALLVLKQVLALAQHIHTQRTAVRCHSVHSMYSELYSTRIPLQSPQALRCTAWQRVVKAAENGSLDPQSSPADAHKLANAQEVLQRPCAVLKGMPRISVAIY